ncbi:MAG: lactonase family protein [Clostridia bacterium]|nr:lactonase family protein [Clostridia bacterium]
METRFYIGTYTGKGSKGMYHGIWQDGALRVTGSTGAVNPSYLTAHQGRLYAAHETGNGAVTAYRIAPDGALTQINQQSAGGDSPCHVSAQGNRLFVSNYSSGTLGVLELDGDGGLPSPPQVIAHKGSGPNADRQEAPHVHQALPTPKGDFVAVCDLGIDAVCFYPLETQGINTQVQTVQTPGGAGPRHAAFGLDQCWYVLCELSCEVLMYRGYGNDAKLIQKYRAMRDRNPQNSGAALQLSPDGKLLLASIRGENTLVLWDVAADGALSGIRWFDTQGDCPRDAAFTPDGSHVFCACERGDRVTVFAVRNAQLAFVHTEPVPTPTCVCFVS